MTILQKVKAAPSAAAAANAIAQGVSELENDFFGMKCRVEDLEQKSARGGSGSDGSSGPSWGREFIESKTDELQQLVGNRGHVGLQVKSTITSTEGASLIVPNRDQTLPLPKRRMRLRDLLSTVDVNSGSVEYPKVITGADGADTVVEGAAKPESNMLFGLETVPIRTVAHWQPASVQILEDVPQLRSIIDVELTYGLAVKEEEQLLFGSGTGVNLDGMVTQATAFADPLSQATPNSIDMIGAAILQAALTENAVDGIVVNPLDWWRMRLLKDADGKYILGDPSKDIEPRLFGLPVVPTQAMVADKFLVGSFSSQTLYNRHDVRIEVSTEHADFFTRNLVAIRAEERIGLAVKRPEALIYGDFGFVV